MGELLGVRSNRELDEEERKRAQECCADEQIIESALCGHVNRAWEANKQAKRTIEIEMLESLRQRNGEYSPTKLAQIRSEGGSEIYMMLTSTKCRAAYAWLLDIILPAGDRAWSVEPTPIPELPEYASEAIKARVMQTTPPETEESQIIDRLGMLRDSVLQELRKFSDKAAERMTDKIEDQLVEGNWEEAMSEFIDDFVTFPAGIKKGPVLRKRKTMKWEGRPGDMKPVVTEEIRLEHQRISPFDAYPSPDATTCQDGEFIERIRFTRAQLHAMIGMKGYNETNIRKVLTDYGRGGLRDWLWTDAERSRLENKEYWWLRGHADTIDGLHYWGSAQGLLLLEFGVDPEKIPDPLGEYNIEVIKVGSHLIRVAINDDPMGRRPYQKACMEAIPGAFWGKTLPYRMRDIQGMCNGSARALATNMAFSSGPMGEINYDRLAPEEDALDIKPFRIFQTQSAKTTGNTPAVSFFQVSSNANELLTVFDTFEAKADDATGVPRYSYGNENVGGAGQTASGLSMLLSNAARGIRAAVAAIDKGVIRPSITAHYEYNMLYDEDKTIKGDSKVQARGAAAILVKEQAQMRRSEFLAITNNETDMQILGIEGRADLLREAASAMDMPKLIPSEEEFKMRLAEQQKNAPPSEEEMKAQQKQMELEAKAKEAEADRENERAIASGRAEAEAKRLEDERIAIDIRRDKDRRAEEKLLLAKLEAQAKEKDEDRTAEIEKMRQEIREAQAAPPKEQQAQQPAAAPVIQLVVDNKSGTIKKTVSINHGADGRISGADIVEETVEE